MCKKLDDWLIRHCSGYGQIAEFANNIKVTTVSLDRYRKGERVPNPETMALIVLHTFGRITPNDFYTLPSREDVQAARTARDAAKIALREAAAAERAAASA